MTISVLPRRARRSARGRARLLAAAVVATALLGTGGYFLASVASSSPSISVAPGTPSSGDIADVTTMSSSVTRTNGGAQLQTGIALAKIVMGYGSMNAVRVEVSWTNALSGSQVLNNPNALISVGLYHAIHTGSCANSVNTVQAPLVNITDTDNNTYCATLDQSETGKFVDSAGKLLLAPNQVDGYMLPALGGSSSLSACTAVVGSPTASQEEAESACQPTSVSNSAQNALFVVASITTPGGLPQGQQANLTSLNFYVQVRADT